jgi:hypothetical protein
MNGDQLCASLAGSPIDPVYRPTRLDPALSLNGSPGRGVDDVC